jgi:CRP/FNR family transcriptional regulator, cyclic AMP receptor protein
LNLAERSAGLGSVPLFAGLAEPTLLAIAVLSVVQDLPAGGILSQDLGRTSSLFLVVRGSMCVSLLSPGGREFVVEIVGRGGALNGLGIDRALDGPALLATAREQTCLLRIPPEAIYRSDACTEILRRSNFALIERLRQSLQLIEDLALYPLEARLARLLARLDGRSRGQAVPPLHCFTQGDLAQMANATRPKVNRYLHDFHRMGAIELQRGSVWMRDAALLAQLAGRER